MLVQKGTFKDGLSRYEWPQVKFSNLGVEGFSPRLLAEELSRTRAQYEELRRRHEAFRKSLATAEKFAEFEKNALEVCTYAESFKEALGRVDKVEKQLAPLVAQAAAAEMVARVKKTAGIDLVFVPAGEFLMGSADGDKDAYDDEKPRHRVTVSRPFCLGKTEVTVGQFKRFVEATGYKTDAEKAGDKRTWKNPGFEQTDDHPVVYVSWNDADAYCKWLAKETGAEVRLPREAEWE
jgi:formylglycine-generating enzyme required for sulfatase activity